MKKEEWIPTQEEIQKKAEEIRGKKEKLYLKKYKYVPRIREYHIIVDKRNYIIGVELK